jgi:putative transposase
MVAATARTIFAQPDAASVRSQLQAVAGMLGSKFPKVEAMLREAAGDLTAFADFPAEHWRKIWSTDENVKGGSGTGVCSGWLCPPAAA